MLDAGKPIPLDLLVSRSGNQFICTKCHLVLVRIEPGGILGQELVQLDMMVILDHHRAKHDPMRPVNLNPDAVFGP